MILSAISALGFSGRRSCLILVIFNEKKYSQSGVTAKTSVLREPSERGKYL
ncbi:MAG: hypothetical protein U5L45_08740 [Saprospiraceae bacterium]|nr:hypothetical protein [Saprospiraceae bacterium]